MHKKQDNEFDKLVGLTLLEVRRGDYKGNDALFFVADNGMTMRMSHEQDCCENVWIEDINGDLSDLIGTPIREAYQESATGRSMEWEVRDWTFYRIRANKGSVTLRWAGESDYYSTDVHCEWIPSNELDGDKKKKRA